MYLLRRLRLSRLLIMKVLIAILMLLVATQGRAFAVEHRIALVIGNANYQTGALPTPANDAGLVAQTLQAAGFQNGSSCVCVSRSVMTFRDLS
jgi:hypothetical protein